MAVMVDPELEKSLLSACMWGGATALTSIDWLPESDLGMIPSQQVLRAMRTVRSAGVDVTPESVLAALKKAGAQFPGTSPESVVAALASGSATGSQAPWFAHQVASLARMRTTAMYARRIMQLSEEGVADETVLARLEAEAKAMLSGLEMPSQPRVDGLYLVSDFLDAADTATDWVVPGLIGAQERIVVVAPEKSGKSVLSRQVAFAVSVGVHPFLPSLRIGEGRPTLVIDLENPGPMLRKELYRQVGMSPLWQHGKSPMHLWHQPGGLPMSDPKGRAALRQVIQQVQPALVSFGPVYKALDRSKAWEEAARELTDVIDEIRAETNAAWWIEHHAPVEERDGMRTMRPYGGSVWLKWPDFQISLYPPDMDPPYPRMDFRVKLAREEDRDWPDRIDREHSWSWVGYWKDGIPIHLREDR